MGYSILPAVVSLERYTKAEHYDPTRDALIACAHAVFVLADARFVAIPAGGGVQDAPNYVEFMVPTSASLGFVYRVEVETRTEDAATTVTPRLYNVTDSTAVWTGAAGVETAWGPAAYQLSSAVTILAGKRYRLQATKSDDAVDAWVVGRIVRAHA